VAAKTYCIHNKLNYRSYDKLNLRELISFRAKQTNAALHKMATNGEGTKFAKVDSR